MCWNEQSQERPSFSELRSKFDAMLLADKKDEYIDLHFDQSKFYYQQFSGASACMESSIPLITDPKSTKAKYLSKSATNLDYSSQSIII